jgi:fumarate reductase subunit C
MNENRWPRYDQKWWKDRQWWTTYGAAALWTVLFVTCLALVAQALANDDYAKAGFLDLQVMVSSWR